MAKKALRDKPAMLVRPPDRLGNRIEEKVKRNASTLQGEIVRGLNAVMEAEGGDAKPSKRRATAPAENVKAVAKRAGE